MKNRLGTIITVAALLAVVLLIFIVAFVLIALVGLGLGWLLIWFSPTFSYFEGTILATIFALIAVILLRALARIYLPPELFADVKTGAWELGEAEFEGRYQTIPSERFYKSAEERTWEAWFLAEIANDIYAEFQHTPQPVRTLNSSQCQELAIRLAEAGVNIMKRKTGRARRLSIGLSDVRRELTRMGQRPYDNNILRLALGAINMNLDYFEEPLREVVAEQQWDRLATMPENES